MPNPVEAERYQILVTPLQNDGSTVGQGFFFSLRHQRIPRNAIRPKGKKAR